MEAPLLRVSNIETAYHGRLTVLRGVSMEVHPGQIVTILGSNGAGKTTLLKTVMGFIPDQPDKGTVEVFGRRVNGWDPEDVAALGVAYIPEGRGIFAELTVEENLHLGGYARSARDVAEDAAAMETRFPILHERRRQMAGTLSGGEQQMLAMGRALMGAPRLLMLDEPSLGLAPIIVADIFRTIGELRAAGVSVLLVEQNAQAALQIADRAYVMELGEFILNGPAKDIATNQRVAASYLGFQHEGASGI